MASWVGSAIGGCRPPNAGAAAEVPDDSELPYGITGIAVAVMPERSTAAVPPNNSDNGAPAETSVIPARVVAVSSVTLRQWPFALSGEQKTVTFELPPSVPREQVEIMRADAATDGGIISAIYFGKTSTGGTGLSVVTRYDLSENVHNLLGALERPQGVSAPRGQFLTDFKQASDADGFMCAFSVLVRDTGILAALGSPYNSNSARSKRAYRKCCGSEGSSPNAWCAYANITSGGSACDSFAEAYCRRSGNDAPEYCACINSPVATSACLDSRCADSPKAYRLPGQPPYSAQTRAPERRGCVGSQVTCDQMQQLGANLVRGYAVPDCVAPDAPALTRKQWLYLAAAVLVVVLAVLLMSGGLSARGKNGTTPLDLFPGPEASPPGLPDISAI